jgi:hypothetical protein
MSAPEWAIGSCDFCRLDDVLVIHSVQDYGPEEHRDKHFCGMCWRVSGARYNRISEQTFLQALSHIYHKLEKLEEQQK